MGLWVACSGGAAEAKCRQPPPLNPCHGLWGTWPQTGHTDTLISSSRLNPEDAHIPLAGAAVTRVYRLLRLRCLRRRWPSRGGPSLQHDSSHCFAPGVVMTTDRSSSAQTIASSRLPRLYPATCGGVGSSSIMYGITNGLTLIAFCNSFLAVAVLPPSR